MENELVIVVVDDVPDLALTMAGVLELDGYTAYPAFGGLEALRVVAKYRPLCVILDIDMPGMDGCELSLQLRERYGDSMVLIAVTGLGDDSERVTETLSRVDHFLKKPVDPKAILKLLAPLQS